MQDNSNSEYRGKGTFEINVGGQTVKVEYNGVTYGIVLHFAFYGKNISSTGYRSHFMFVEEYLLLKYTNYRKCAQDIANALYEDLKKERIKDGIIVEQLDLFKE